MKNTTRTIKATTALIASLGLTGLVACGTDEGVEPQETVTATQTAEQPEEATPTETLPPSPTPPPEATDPSEPVGDQNTETKQQLPEGSFDLVIEDIRIASHDGFDRVVFDLSGTGSPGWWVDYTSEPTQQASGLPVDVNGDIFLDVNIDGIAYPPSEEDPGIPSGSYPGAGAVTEVVLTSIFEARAQFIIGLDHGATPYSVSMLTEPTRVVIDIAYE